MQSLRQRWGWAAQILVLGWVVGLGTSLPAAPMDLFPDAGLEAAVRSQVFAKRGNREPLVEADVAQVSTIVARGRGIRSLAGLEKCRSLAMLDVAANDVTDLGPLAGLARLQFLDLQSNRVSELGPLANVTTLQYLHLGDNAVGEVSALAGLTNLATLHLSGNRVSSIAPLMGLHRLTSLYLNDNWLSSMDGIGSLRSLSSLALSGNRISDLKPLQGLNGLQYLFLERNQIRDLDDLQVWLKKDESERFAPYIQIYLAGNPLGSVARRRSVPALKAAGIRILP
jgi:internalin A